MKRRIVIGMLALAVAMQCLCPALMASAAAQPAMPHCHMEAAPPASHPAPPVSRPCCLAASHNLAVVPAALVVAVPPAAPSRTTTEPPPRLAFPARAVGNVPAAQSQSHAPLRV